jgi:hypothetical protein
VAELVIGAETGNDTDTGGLDNVVLFPEPSTLALLFIGAAVLPRRRR